MRALVVFHPAKAGFEAASIARLLGAKEYLGLAFEEEAAQKASSKGYTTFLAKIDAKRVHSIAEALKTVINELSPDYIVLPSLKILKSSAALVAQESGLPLITDVLRVEDGTLVRSVLSGRALSYENADPPLILTVPAGRFEPFEPGGQGEVRIVHLESSSPVSSMEVREKKAGAVKLEEARVIVSVGRGFKKKEDLKLAFELAEVLGAQIGCSRPIAADLKWLGEEHWVGLSGKKVKPDIYIAIGISGQPQHIAGIIDSKIIVAINKDKNAPIFANADYGIVGDLYEVVPILTKKLKELKA